MPFCSIVTINFNQAKNLQQTLTSVALQEFRDFESIVIDGGSSDESVEIAGRYKEIISQLVSEKDHGIYDAMNKGAALAHGEWLIFLNAGDVFSDKHTLKECAGILRETKSEIVYGNSIVEYPSMKRTDRATHSDEWRRMPYIHQSVWYRKQVAIDFPFNSSYRICSDYDQFLRMKAAGISFKRVPLVISCVSSGGLSDVRRDQASREKRRIFLQHHPSSHLRSVYFIFEALKGKAGLFLHRFLPERLSGFLRKLKYSA